MEFLCGLRDMVCDACRGAVTGELKKEAGIRAVRFEGADRKELVVGHSARLKREARFCGIVRQFAKGGFLK